MAGKKPRPRPKKGPVEKPRRGKPKVCVFCRDRIPWVDYKDSNLLRRLMTDRGKIKARRVSGTCRQHQREVSIAIKTAREMALLPYVVRTTGDKLAGRNGRGAGRGGGRPTPTGGTGAAATPSTEGTPDAAGPVAPPAQAGEPVVASDGTA